MIIKFFSSLYSLPNSFWSYSIYLLTSNVSVFLDISILLPCKNNIFNKNI